MNEEKWIERALIAEQKLVNVAQIAKRLHDNYKSAGIALELDDAMRFDPSDPIDWDFLKHMESNKCGYIVPEGHTYCRECGGGGLYEGNECVPCSANGSNEHPEWKNKVETE